MRNVLKAETLERKFPLLSVENGCIVSKDADLTVAFEVELPELYTVTAEEYEAMHSTWIKAARVLPEHRTDGIAQFGGGIEIRGHEAGRLVDTGKALALALRESTGGNRRAHH